MQFCPIFGKELNSLNIFHNDINLPFQMLVIFPFGLHSFLNLIDLILNNPKILVKIDTNDLFFKDSVLQLFDKGIVYQHILFPVRLTHSCRIAVLLDFATALAFASLLQHLDLTFQHFYLYRSWHLQGENPLQFGGLLLFFRTRPAHFYSNYYKKTLLSNSTHQQQKKSGLRNKVWGLSVAKSFWSNNGIDYQCKGVKSPYQILKMLRYLSGTYMRTFSSGKQPMRVAVTGAAGQICYSMLFRIANGDMLGYDQPIILHLIDIPQAQKALTGVAMQLGDCAFPLLRDIVCTDDLKVGFRDIDAALLVGAKPRGKGMERGDLLQENAKIFIPQGKALNEYANRDVKTLVVGNPANTNCLIAATHAKDLPKENFCAMTRLDHDRAVWQVAEKTGSAVTDIAKVVVWGNHSPTMSPDLGWATVKGQPALDLVGNDWYVNKFIPRVQKRGAQIIEARGLSSAASAGSAAIAHMRSWFQGHTDDWVSFGAWSNNNPYGIPDGLFYSFPVTVSQRKWTVIKGLNINEDQRKRMTHTANELTEERKAISDLLKV